MIVSKTLFFHMNLPDLFYENVPSMKTLCFWVGIPHKQQLYLAYINLFTNVYKKEGQ